MIVFYSNKVNPDTGIVSGFQLYEIYDGSGSMIDKRILDINFKPISDLEFNELIKTLDFEIIKIYGDYSYSEFDNETSNFMIYKLRKKSTKA